LFVLVLIPLRLLLPSSADEDFYVHNLPPSLNSLNPNN
jgi:hypothetical protein